MGNLNKAMIIGRLGADPEVRYTQANTAIANFNVATTERYRDANGEVQENTEWHRIVAWGKLAEVCQKYAKKGSQIYIEGPIQTRQWEDKEGQKRYTTEIKALTIQLLDSRQDGGAAVSGTDTKPAVGKGKKADLNDFDAVDDDLPF
jgi:single-strand DNA-binding protein